MKQDIHYVISEKRTTEDTAEVLLALKEKRQVAKIIRTEYVTGSTKVVLATISKITKPKEI